jgi:hypothetical protein
MSEPVALPSEPAGSPNAGSSGSLNASAHRHSTSGLLVAAFAATAFLSASLLFTIQLIFGKTVLPLFGGSAAVWTTCMLFFQAALLAGYAYAHALTAWTGLRGQVPIHAALIGLSLSVLPPEVPFGSAPPAGAEPVPWLLRLLTISLGLPFFAVSATAPLIQHWFSRTGHPSAENPYFLYAASNLGSMVGLLGYPTVIEPLMTLSAQRWDWSAGYWIFSASMLACAVLVVLARGAKLRPHSGPVQQSLAVSHGLRIRWVLLSLVPSSLLLGVTQYITTDIAPIPLLWVMPLALYLLTFVLVFGRSPLAHETTVRLQPFALIPLVLLWFWKIPGTAPIFIPLHLAAFFITAMVCHGELARLRPPAGRLTEFYLWISVGGVLGGLVNVLLAPALFTSLTEYPLGIIAACLLRPGAPKGAQGVRTSSLALLALALVPGALLLAVAARLGALDVALRAEGAWTVAAVSAASSVAAVLAHALRFRSFPFGISLAGILAAGVLASSGRSPVLYAERNFFGVHHVTEENGGAYRVFRHGTTIHGAQAQAPALRAEPLTYFSREGPLGKAFDVLPTGATGRQVAVIGLGAGSMSAYARAGEHWTYYEIDPAVERIARDPRLFTFLRDCPAELSVVLGDARLSLETAREAEYDIIALDAFSSDVIPVHLLTREAFALYLSRLSPDGVLLLHLSNRYLDLVEVVAAIANDAGLVGRFHPADPISSKQVGEWIVPSTWAVISRKLEPLRGLAQDPHWVPLDQGGHVRPWSDDFSNLWSVFNWQ